MIKTFEEFKHTLLKDPEVKQEYDRLKPEFDIAKALIEARLASHMTQKEVALKMHTSQTQIARMESGNHMPSLHSIIKYAKAVHQKIKIEIFPLGN